MSRTGHWPPTRRDIVLSPSLPAKGQQVLDELEHAGREGLTQMQIREALCVGYAGASAMLRRLELRGLIFVDHEEGGATGAKTINRWRLARYRPRRAAVVGTSVATARSGPVWERFVVGVAPRVVDPAQCRPWAVAATGGVYG